MPSTTLVPVSDISTTSWSEIGPGTDFFDQVDDGFPADDNTSFVETTTDSAVLKLGLTNRPSNFDFADTVNYTIRITTEAKHTKQLKFRIFESDGTSAITSLVTISTAANSWMTLTGSMSITGTNNSTSWTDPQLHVHCVDLSSSSLSITAVDIDVDFTETSEDIGSPWYHYLTGRD